MSYQFPASSPFEIAVALGADLRARRLAMNLTQGTLAERAGVSVSTLKRLEAKGTGSLRDVISIVWSLGLRDAFTGLVPPLPPTSIEAILKANAAASPRRRASSPRVR